MSGTHPSLLLGLPVLRPGLIQSRVSGVDRLEPAESEQAARKAPPDNRTVVVAALGTHRRVERRRGPASPQAGVGSDTSLSRIRPVDAVLPGVEDGRALCSAAIVSRESVWRGSREATAQEESSVREGFQWWGSNSSIRDCGWV